MVKKAIYRGQSEDPIFRSRKALDNLLHITVQIAVLINMSEVSCKFVTFIVLVWSNSIIML